MSDWTSQSLQIADAAFRDLQKKGPRDRSNLYQMMSAQEIPQEGEENEDEFEIELELEKKKNSSDKKREEEEKRMAKEAERLEKQKEKEEELRQKAELQRLKQFEKERKGNEIKAKKEESKKKKEKPKQQDESDEDEPEDSSQNDEKKSKDKKNKYLSLFSRKSRSERSSSVSSKNESPSPLSSSRKTSDAPLPEPAFPSVPTPNFSTLPSEREKMKNKPQEELAKQITSDTKHEEVESKPKLDLSQSIVRKPKKSNTPTIPPKPTPPPVPTSNPPIVSKTPSIPSKNPPAPPIPKKPPPTAFQQQEASKEEVQSFLTSSVMMRNRKGNRPNAIFSSTKFTETISKEMSEWEKTRKQYSEKVEPLLRQKQEELQVIFDDYLERLKDVITSQKLGDEVRDAMLEEETSRLAKCKQQLFGNLNASLGVMEKEVKSRKHLLDMEKKIILIQSLWRGHQERKRFKKEYGNIVHRTKVVREIIETEKTYLENLGKLINQLITPLRAKAFTPNQILSSSDISLVFSNIELIANVGRELHDELEERIQNWSNTQCIGDVFLRLAPFLKLYIQYVNNFNLAASREIELMKENEEYCSLVKSVFSPSTQSLENYLILPVQRIPRYEMLLKSVVKYTDEDHPDFQNLCNALFKIKDVANKINESKRMAENTSKIIEIQEKMGLDNLIQPHRRFVEEGGPFYKLKEPKPQHATRKIGNSWFYLFNDILIIAQKPKVPINLQTMDLEDYRFHDLLQLEDIEIKEDDEEEAGSRGSLRKTGKFFFHLVVKSKKFTFFTENYREKLKWCNLITQQTIELKRNRQTLKPAKQKPPKKEEVVRLPQVPKEEKKASSTELPDIPIPNFGPTPNPLIEASLKPTKLREVLTLFGKVYATQEELFQLPIELETLIPEFCQKMHPSRLKKIFEKIQMLKAKVEEMQVYRTDLMKLLEKDVKVVELSQILNEGQDTIGQFRQWVADNFPKGSTNPAAKRARVLTAYLMEWYIKLADAWESLLEEKT